MTAPRRLTRRRALTEALGTSGGLLVGTGSAASLGIAGCGTSAGAGASASGSTLHSTWSDPVGDGQLRVTAGEPLRERLELGPRAAVSSTLATFAHVTDAHVLDASSPARVSFLDRLGPPFQSTFRPQEALTAQVLTGTATAVRSLSPGLVIQGGDLIDNDQSNELTHALSALIGGRVSPGSGRLGYYGVQLGGDTDPFYYRPAVDAPRYPRLLRDAVRPFLSHGVRAPVYPVLGDHDALVAGTLLPTALTRSLAVGSRALWDLPTGLALPDGARLGRVTSPDGPPDPGAVSQLLTEALRGPTVPVPPDAARYQLSFPESVARLQRAGGSQTALRDGDRLDYVIDVGERLRFVVLDIVRRGGGSEGLIDPAQPAWLARQLALAGERWVIVVTHQPIASSVGGDALFAVLDRAPRVIAALCGHIHRNQITPRATAAGGYWLIATASLIDYPQQARAIAVDTTADGGVAIRTWMLDHAGAGSLGPISRQLSYLDPEGGRPKGAAGSPADRNVILHRRPAR
ncbi:MAG: metallophosphoesterase [Actinomycetota bacterium]|nr:metallophosphoesterase [Actinomycetota bacterium]